MSFSLLKNNVLTFWITFEYSLKTPWGCILNQKYKIKKIKKIKLYGGEYQMHASKSTFVNVIELWP